MTFKRIVTFVLLAVALLALSAVSAVAKGPPGYIDFEVPGMWRNFRLEKPDVPMELSMGQFSDFLSPVEGPDNLGAGFIMTRGWFDEDGEAVPWDRLFFFANLDGDLGYVYYFGLVNGSSEYDGRWFQVSAEGQAKLIEVLNEEGVHFAGLNPGEYYTFGEGRSAMATDPVVEESALEVAGLPTAMGALALAGLGLWWVSRAKRD